MGYMGYDRQRLLALRKQMDGVARHLGTLRCADPEAADANRAIAAAAQSLATWIPIVDTVITQDPLGSYRPGGGLPTWSWSTDPDNGLPGGGGSHGGAHGRGGSSDAPLWSSFSVDGRFQDKLFRKLELPIRRRPGSGEVDVDLFISAAQAGILGMHDEGNKRGFILDAKPEQSKVQVHLNFETGVATMIVAPSCDKNEEGCVDAREIQLVAPGEKMDHSKNNIQITEDDDEVRLQVRGLNARRAVTGPTHAPSIDDVYLLIPNLSGGDVWWSEKGDRFPSEMIQQNDGKGGKSRKITTYSEQVDAIGVPELTDDGWGDLQNDAARQLHP
jgi:hypothetical protein